MGVIHLSATAGADGVLHLSVPVGAAGAEFEITVTPKVGTNGTGRKPTPEELGWPPGYFDKTFGSITDESFQAPERRVGRPITPLGADE